MSYDLFFWREESKAKLDPTQVLKTLRDTVSLNGILPIPLVEVKQAFKNEFPDICDSGSALEWEKRRQRLRCQLRFSRREDRQSRNDLLHVRRVKNCGCTRAYPLCREIIKLSRL